MYEKTHFIQNESTSFNKINKGICIIEYIYQQTMINSANPFFQHPEMCAM